MNEVAIEALNSERPDPLWHNDGSAPFDWAEVFARCDGSLKEPGSAETEVPSEALLRFSQWLVLEPDGRIATDLRRIGLRAVAAATALGVFANVEGLSQRGVAERLKVPVSSLNDAVRAFLDQFPGLSRQTKTARKPQQIRPELN